MRLSGAFHYVEDADSRVCGTKRKSWLVVSLGSADDCPWQVADHGDDIARLPVEDPHFIFASTAAEEQVLIFVEGCRVDVWRDIWLLLFGVCLGLSSCL